MRKLKRLIILLVFLGIVFSGKYCFAGNAGEKLGRGLANTASGWLEIGAEIFRESEKSDTVGALFILSPLKGFLKGIGRTAVGIYETVTFLVPLPGDYQPIIEPEFVF